MKMNLNYKHLGMYLLAGIASSLLCHLIYDDDNVWQLYVGPPLVLGIAIFLSGRYTGNANSRNTWISPLVLVISCTIGWILATRFGSEYYDETDLWIIASGVIGGAGVAVGFVAAWKVQKIWVVFAMITAAGGLGGAVLILLDIAGIHFISLFVVWQSIVLLGIGFVIQIDSNQASQRKPKSL
jgi:hypothetical protein